MEAIKIFYALLLMLAFGNAAANEWTFIGKTVIGASVFTTNAENLGDGSLRVFLRAEQELLRKPEGLLAMFKKPEKYIEKSDPFSLLIHCKRRSVREYQPGVFGKEFYIPWEPITPGSFGSVAFNAFCKK